MFQTLYFDFLCVFGLLFDENEVYFWKKNAPSWPGGAMNCVFCSHFDCCIIYAFKESLCFLHYILHSFICLKPINIFCRYYSLELGNTHFIFMCRIWFVLDLECMSDPCCFESFFTWGDFCFLLHADFFSAW